MAKAPTKPKTTAAKKPTTRKPSTKTAKVVQDVDADGEAVVVALGAKPAKAKKPAAPKGPPAPFVDPRTRVERGATVVHYDDEGRTAIDRLLPLVDAVQAAGDLVVYNVSHSDGTVYLGIALPGQNAPYSEMPGLMIGVDARSDQASFDHTPLGLATADLVRDAALDMLATLRGGDGDEQKTPLGWRQDWQLHAHAAAESVAERHSATRH